jgi:hypothetical protein
MNCPSPHDTPGRMGNAKFWASRPLTGGHAVPFLATARHQFAVRVLVRESAAA